TAGFRVVQLQHHLHQAAGGVVEVVQLDLARRHQMWQSTETNQALSASASRRRAYSAAQTSASFSSETMAHQPMRPVSCHSPSEVRNANVGVAFSQLMSHLRATSAWVAARASISAMRARSPSPRNSRIGPVPAMCVSALTSSSIPEGWTSQAFAQRPPITYQSHFDCGLYVDQTFPSASTSLYDATKSAWTCSSVHSSLGGNESSADSGS